MNHPRDALVQGFVEGLADLQERVPGLHEAVDDLDREAARAYGHDAGQRALAALVWRVMAGEAITTEQARVLLGISRQALHQRVASGTLLGLPTARTTLFPTWQFEDGRVRPVVAALLGAFLRRLGGDVDPRMVLSWATTPQPELKDETPAEWLVRHGDDEPLLRSAERAADALAC